MHIFLSIDDTDNLDSPGSGQLAEILTTELLAERLISEATHITRHQLFFHESIPYTSHNSSMCFSATLPDNTLTDVITYSTRFLEDNSATGSDPGLCVAIDNGTLRRPELIDFGKRAKKTRLSKTDAYRLAQETGIHLSEHGGSGDGIIGALAAVGLRLGGNDGRFRGWLNLGLHGEIISAHDLCRHASIDDVVDGEGESIPKNSPVLIANTTIKTILRHHRQVLPVARSDGRGGSKWTTLTKAEVKCF